MNSPVELQGGLCTVRTPNHYLELLPRSQGFGNQRVLSRIEKYTLHQE